jgi:aminoglycoside/choline kinase family phosphotransferase
VTRDISKEQLSQWLSRQTGQAHPVLDSLAGDAGFRRYFRFSLKQQSYIAVDAPPEHINNLAFVEILKVFAQAGLQVPKLEAVDLTQGFLCLSDLGNITLADVLNTQNVENYYRQALSLLPTIAGLPAPQNWSLPVYDSEFIQRELDIFTDWLLNTHLQLKLTSTEQKLLNSTFKLLSDTILAQPQVVMHRDFHSRNLMVTGDQELAIIDFQDAVIGPVTYDAVSLLRDCYVRWPPQLVTELSEIYRQKLQSAGIIDVSKAQFSYWFDLTGMQRHIKASGIFARLYHRDGKSGYLADIPLTLKYLVDVGGKYPQTQTFASFVEERVLPAFIQGREQGQ